MIFASSKIPKMKQSRLTHLNVLYWYYVISVKFAGRESNLTDFRRFWSLKYLMEPIPFKILWENEDQMSHNFLLKPKDNSIWFFCCQKTFSLE